MQCHCYWSSRLPSVQRGVDPSSSAAPADLFFTSRRFTQKIALAPGCRSTRRWSTTGRFLRISRYSNEDRSSKFNELRSRIVHTQFPTEKTRDGRLWVRILVLKNEGETRLGSSKFEDRISPNLDGIQTHLPVSPPGRAIGIQFEWPSTIVVSI